MSLTEDLKKALDGVQKSIDKIDKIEQSLVAQADQNAKDKEELLALANDITGREKKLEEAKAALQAQATGKPVDKPQA